jgi:MraZ protein
MFRGRFEHSLDEKGRIAIPSRFREALKEDETLFVTHGEKCLTVYPQAEWFELEVKIAKLPQFDPKIAAFKRLVIGCAQECSIDKAGRILLPPDLRRDARIDKDCIVLGQLNKIEIWSRDLWETMFASANDQFNLIAQSLVDMGISL